MKRLLALLLFVILCSHYCQQATDSFTIAKVGTFLLDAKQTDVSEELLSHSYRYYTKGGQSYVFLSEDDRYVLKLTRSPRLSRARFLTALFPTQKNKGTLTKEENLLRKTLESHWIAAKHLQKETGILAVHLSNDGQLKSPLKIIDKLGIKHTIDPNLHPFIIQEMVVPVKTKIGQLMEKEDLITSKILLRELFALLSFRKKLGIEDEDPNLTKNFGFSAGKAIQFDTGRFTFANTSSEKRVANSKEDLQHWINANHPALSEALNTAYQEYIDGDI